MRDFGDLNMLIKFAREKAVSIEIIYSESSDEMSIEVISAAESERFQVKRVTDIERFIKRWAEHVASNNARKRLE